MKLITERMMIQSVADELKKKWPFLDQNREQKAQLAALDLNTATAEEVNAITELPHLTATPSCSECGHVRDRVVELSEVIDGELDAVCLCLACAEKVVALLKSNGVV
jgi:hypothetical protein